MYHFGQLRPPEQSLNSLYLEPDEAHFSYLRASLAVPGFASVPGSVVFSPDEQEQSTIRFKYSDRMGLKLIKGVTEEHLVALCNLDIDPMAFNAMQSGEISSYLLKCNHISTQPPPHNDKQHIFTLKPTSKPNTSSDYLMMKCYKMQHMRRSQISPYSLSYSPTWLFKLDDSEACSDIWDFVRYSWFSRAPSITQERLVEKVFLEKLSKHLEYSTSKYFRAKEVKFEGISYGVLELCPQHLKYTPLLNRFHEERKTIRYSCIRYIRQFRHQFLHDSIEIWTYLSPSSVIYKLNEEIRNEVYDTIKDKCSYLLCYNTEEIQKQWIHSQISNFQYLSYLNMCSNRSFNDISQYPIFPWVIHDYTTAPSPHSPLPLRNLSLPIGATNKHRIRRLKIKQEQLLKHQKDAPLYRVHYSLACNIKYFLIRKVPELIIRLQQEAVVPPDRIFTSIEQVYYRTMNGDGDFKELTPEFYGSDCGWLLNGHGLVLGRDREGKEINDVTLPPWAKNPLEFLQEMRKALECEAVRQSLNEWIDLVFGCKQRDSEAVKSNNHFDKEFFEDGRDFQKTNYLEREALRRRARDFGQMPLQVFSQPHPKSQPKSKPKHVKEPQLSRIEESKFLLGRLTQLMREYPSAQVHLNTLGAIIQEERFKTGMTDSDSSLGSDIKGDTHALRDFLEDDIDL